MSNRFSETDLARLGYVKDAEGNYVPRGKATVGCLPAVQPEPTAAAKGKFGAVKKDRKGMNKTEAQYAQRLEALKIAGEIIDYKFEKITLKIAADTRLTPDFFIQYADGRLELHDVKGHIKIYQDDAKVKMKVAASTFRMFTFRVVFPQKEKLGGGWIIKDVPTE